MSIWIRKLSAWLTLVLLTGFLLNGCKSYKEQEDALPDTSDRGTIYVSADESFKPVIDEQVRVYESNNPGTKIQVAYKPEAECLKDMLVDSVRMIIATRYYTDEENARVADSLGVGMMYRIAAKDAIAVIVNPQSEDSILTMSEIKQILTGNFNKTLIPVFDGIKATSTVRFIIDSVLRGDSLTPEAMAARSSEEVIDYIAKSKNAVGFIGVSWVGNKDDTAQLGFLKKVKIVRIQSARDTSRFVIPVQNNIFNKSYPMVRDLVYILKERHKGLGHGFADFMSGEKGQLIFKRAYLVPAQRDFRMREARLRDN